MSVSPNALKFGVAAAVLIGLVFIVFRFDLIRSRTNTSTSNFDAGQRNMQRPTPSTEPTPAPGPSNNNGARPAPDPANAGRIAHLIQQLNADDEGARRAATGALKEHHASDPLAVEQALGLLDEAKIGGLSPQGLINVLFFLNSATDAAWTIDSFQKGTAALQTLDGMELRPKAKEESSTLRSRLRQVLTNKLRGGVDDGEWARQRDNNSP